jgi:hypothetical protein
MGALLIAVAAAAAAAAALVFRAVPGWKEASPHGGASGGVSDGASDGASDGRRPQTHEEVVAALSEEQKERMLRELGHHV